MNNTYLAHHGVLGMKWGVRRYQNKDGSLTAAGQKHYGKMSGKKIYKSLKKQVHKQRASVHGGSNRWMRNKYIGDNSKSLIEEHRKKDQEYFNTEAYKNYEKKMKRLWQDGESGKIDAETYEKKYDAIKKTMPKRNYASVYDYAIVYGDSGRKYTNDFINKAGKELSMAYLKDLGYNEKTAEKFIKKMAKSGYSLGDV